MYLPALTIGTGTLKQGKFTNVSAAARAVIGAGTGKKLAPAGFAQIVIGFANALFTVDADRRPKELI